MKSWMLVLVGALALTLTGVASAEPINDTCPIKGKAVDGSKVVSVEVKFCCENCKGKFDKNPGAYLKNVAKAKDGQCPMSGKAAADASSTVEIAVCCGGCKGKVEADPKKFLGSIKAKKAA